MTHTCRECNRTFTSELEYELHRDMCSADQLVCEQCGERFAEATATKDGWHYRCPTEGCDGAGIGDELHSVEKLRLASR